MLTALRNVNGGEPAMNPIIANKLMQELHRKSDLPSTEEPMTERELDILK